MGKNILLTLLIIGQSTLVYGFDFDEYLALHNEDSTAVFLENFPFDAYISAYGIDNISILEKHRQVLREANIDGEDFLYEIFSQYFELSLFEDKNIVALGGLVKLGILYRNIDKSIIDSTLIYKTVGRMILKKSCFFLESMLKTGEIKVEHPEIQYLIRELDKNKFVIDIPKRDVEKLKDNIRSGNWEYLWRKLKSRSYDNRRILIPIGLMAIVFFVFIYKKRKKI